MQTSITQTNEGWKWTVKHGEMSYEGVSPTRQMAVDVQAIGVYVVFTGDSSPELLDRYKTLIALFSYQHEAMPEFAGGAGGQNTYRPTKETREYISVIEALGLKCMTSWPNVSKPMVCWPTLPEGRADRREFFKTFTV